MRRKPILSFLLAAAILGGIMVYLFPHLWMVLVIALLVLITVQVIVVRRSLFTLPPGRTEMAMPASPPDTAPAKTTQSSAQPVPPHPSTQPGEGAESFESAFEATETTERMDTKDSVGSAQAAPGQGEGEAPTAAGKSKPAETRKSAGISAAKPAAKSDPGGKTDSPKEEDAIPPAIDTSVFSRFQEHLERVEREGPGQPRSPRRGSVSSGRGQTISGEDGEVEIVVDLSSAARQPPAHGKGGKGGKGAKAARPAQPTQPASAVPEEETGPDLFADLRPEPLIKTPGTKQDADAGSRAADSVTPDSVTEVQTPPQDGPGKEGDAPATPVPTEGATEEATEEADVESPASSGKAPPEIAAPVAPSAAPDTATLESEAAALLKLAEEAAAREDWEESRAGVRNYLAHLSEHPELVNWRARRLEARMAVLAGDANRALQGFEAMLEAGYQPAVEGVPTLLEELLQVAGEATDEALGNNLRVSMLVRILAVFRQSRDQGAMDRAYGWIEMAQEKVGDEKKLIQYLKNHLEIRRSMGNVAGQLELIDQLGNRCYKLGLTEEAKVYYEMGLKLKGEKGDPGDEKEGGETADERG